MAHVLERAHQSAAQQCLEQIRHNMKVSGRQLTEFSRNVILFLTDHCFLSHYINNELHMWAQEIVRQLLWSCHKKLPEMVWQDLCYTVS
jgi:hypothetical protein